MTLVRLRYSRGAAPITDHLRGFALDLEKCKTVQIYLEYVDRYQEDCNFSSNLMPLIELIVNFLKPKVGMDILQCLESAITTTHSDRSFLTLTFKTQDMCHDTIGSSLIET